MASSSTRSSKSGLASKLKTRALARSFYERDTVAVAKDLLGKVLWVDDAEGEPCAVRIVETEAYRENDPASHSCRGETPRSAIMFKNPGVAYVYFIYGMYEMLNFVTEPSGTAGAVLIRAGEPVAGVERMLARRHDRARAYTSKQRAELAAGPGKLCRALGIRMSDNGQSLEGPRIRVVDDGFAPDSISASPRVGITQAKDTLWRFFVTGNPHVSRAPQNAMAQIAKRGA